MYKDVGNKIKFLGQIVGWIPLILGCFVWYTLISNGNNYYGHLYYDESDDIWGWIALVAGILGYVASWFLYGFGQVVDDVHAIREKQVGLPENTETLTASQIESLLHPFGRDEM